MLKLSSEIFSWDYHLTGQIDHCSNKPVPRIICAQWCTSLIFDCLTLCSSGFKSNPIESSLRACANVTLSVERIIKPQLLNSDLKIFLTKRPEICVFFLSTNPHMFGFFLDFCNWLNIVLLFSVNLNDID